MSKRTKAGRKASFRAFCDPDREGKLMDRSIEKTCAALKRARIQNDIRRSLYRTGAMFLIGLVADKVMGAR